MPLPPNGTQWPPKQLEKVTPHLREWDAWYSGDAVKLAETYGYIGGAGLPGYPMAPGFQYQYPGGVRGRIARWFWGQPIVGQQLTKLHVPIAADLCQAGADLLFSEPVTLTVDCKAGNKATQDRLNELADDTVHGVLAEGAEIGGALGGHYLRVSWDRDVVPDKPFLTAVHADAAWPEFAYGRLLAVTFWTRLPTVDNTVWRHLERHELDGQGHGVILHGLYRGTEHDLGRAVPLTERPETKGLTRPGLLTDGQVISTESPGLACVYIPNQRPQRRWRNDPVGSSLGRSDLDGIEPLMDAFDETYSSWMRDIRLGKARVFVARSMLDSNGPGQGGSVDLDQEVFTPLNMLANPNAASGSGLPIQAEQFQIRFAEHKATADQLLEAILRTAGYSSQTFGMDGTGRQSNMTATEVQAHERRSYLTRDRKIRMSKPQVSVIMAKLLAVDRAIFGSRVTPQPVDVAFSDAVQESQITLAQTVQALDQARAASTQTRVQMVHPDWDDDQIQAEVARIQAEEALAAPAMPDTTMFGSDPAVDPTVDPAADPAATTGS